jgi:hypothetical protein
MLTIFAALGDLVTGDFTLDCCLPVNIQQGILLVSKLQHLFLNHLVRILRELNL